MNMARLVWMTLRYPLCILGLARSIELAESISNRCEELAVVRPCSVVSCLAEVDAMYVEPFITIIIIIVVQHILLVYQITITDTPDLAASGP